MWPSDRPATLYQPINHEDHEDETTPADRVTVPHGRLAPRAPVPEHFLMRGDHQLRPDQLLGGDKPLKKEQLLGGTNSINKSMLLEGRTVIGDHLLLNPRREDTDATGVKGEEEQGLLDFDHVEDYTPGMLRDAKRPRLTFRKAVYLCAFLVTLIALVTTVYVFTAPGKNRPLGPGDYKRN